MADTTTKKALQVRGDGSPYADTFKVLLWLGGLLGIFCVGCESKPQPSAQTTESSAVQEQTDDGGQGSGGQSAGDGLSAELANEVVGERVDPEPTLPPPSEFIVQGRPDDAATIRAEAMQLGQHVVQEFGEKADAHEVKARLHLLVGDNEKARSTWQRALEVNAEYPFAVYGLGKVAHLQGDHGTAVAYLAKAADALPDYYYAHHDLAAALHADGRLDEAVTVLQNFARTHGSDAQTWLLLGLKQLEQQRFEEAKQSLENALRIAPDQPRAEEALGRALVRLGRREEAQALFDKQELTRESQSKNRSAEQVFDDELREYASKYADVAKVYLSEQELESALAILVKASYLDPENTSIWATLMDVCQSLGQMTLASRLTTRMLQANGEDPSAFYTAGVIQSRAGDWGLAKQSFRRLVELAPDSPRGYSAFARLSIQTRTDPELALQYALKAVELRGNGSDHELVAQIYASTGQFGEAKLHLEKAIELEPNNQAYAQAMQQLVAVMKSTAEQ